MPDRTRPDLTSPDLAALLPSWELFLRAEHRAPATVKAYGLAVRQFVAWCAAHGRPAVLDRATVAAFIAGLFDAGAEPTTARLRQLALRRYAAWLVDEGELPADPLVGIKPPSIDAKIVEPLTDDQLRALIKACSGLDAFRDRRDEAIVRLLAETGARAGEVIALAVADLDLQAGTAIIRRGKGGKGRVVPFGAQTARAIDRYLRERRHHRLADTPPLWLGTRGRTLSYAGMHSALRGRATVAGLVGFHPHMLRHTFTHRWLAAGGSEQAAMSIAGWSRPDMLLRYSKAQASARAADEARKLNLGEI